MLRRAIESKNQEGFDYLEFKNALKSLDKMIPDEATRYKSAFEMGKTMGLTKDSLIQYANLYINVLEAERKKFNDAVENQKSTKIQERAQQLDEMEAQIAQKEELIKKLQGEIEQIKKSLTTVKQEIDESASKIDQRNAQFQASFALVYNQIAGDIEKIKQHIQ
jgi:septal ring factor EnvC (AmiA/AmiB activator)